MARQSGRLRWQIGAKSVSVSSQLDPDSWQVHGWHAPSPSPTFLPTGNRRHYFQLITEKAWLGQSVRARYRSSQMAIGACQPSAAASSTVIKSPSSILGHLWTFPRPRAIFLTRRFPFVWKNLGGVIYGDVASLHNVWGFKHSLICTFICQKMTAWNDETTKRG